MLNSNSDFVKLALKSYDNPQLRSELDFNTDIKRFGNINTALNRYNIDGDQKRLRIALNHLVILSNVFGIEETVEMCRFKLLENLDKAETLMLFLNMIDNTEVAPDKDLLKILETL
jgi:hypothetical protein